MTLLSPNLMFMYLRYSNQTLIHTVIYQKMALTISASAESLEKNLLDWRFVHFGNCLSEVVFHYYTISAIARFLDTSLFVWLFFSIRKLFIWSCLSLLHSFGGSQIFLKKRSVWLAVFFTLEIVWSCLSLYVQFWP